MLKFIYTIFIGLLIALFVGLGIDAFYSAPKAPEYPEAYKFPTSAKLEEDKTAEEKAAELETQRKYEEESKKYQEEYKLHNRNVSIISLSIAVIILALSVIFATQLGVIADGAILGGVFTLIYAIIRGFEAGDPKFRFIVTTVGLVVALVLGYVKFIKPHGQIKPTN
jgi:hypothetical protein